jgi:predicted alpha/beta hydrolase
MTLRKTLLTAAVLLVSIPVVPALAHDDEDNRYDSHDRFHDQLSDAHERAHEYGFYSRGEHRAYHRAHYSRPRFYGFGWGY